ncbi:MAG: DUF5320 domain-containing protein [Anaerolineae bacterium]|jgi:hypothetical protein
MPQFDGTGPRGAGPMTGRGEGYCVLELSESGRPAHGYAGLEGAPVHLEPLATKPVQLPRTPAWFRPVFGRGRGWAAARRGRGHRFHRW